MYLQAAFKGYLKMFHQPMEYVKYHRTPDPPDQAACFTVAELLTLYENTRDHPTPINLRAWTYILLSVSLFLRKSEARDLQWSDVEMPCSQDSGDVLTDSGVPKYIYILIQKSKTDQTAEGTFNLTI